MKNRYAVNNGLIGGTDNSYTAVEWYETDDTLLCHESGEPLWKIDKGKHKARTQSEIENGTIYIAKHNAGIDANIQGIVLSKLDIIVDYISKINGTPQAIKDIDAAVKAEKAKKK